MVGECGGRETLLERELGTLVDADRELVVGGRVCIDARGNAGLQLGGVHRERG
jgi:hypothetical protein